MPKQYVVLYTCSFCGEKAIDGDGFSSLVLAAAEGTKSAAVPKPLGVDACEACTKGDVLGPLIAAGYPIKAAKKDKADDQVEAAAAVGSPSSPVGNHVCDFCGKVSTTIQGLTAHRRWHTASPEELEATRAKMRAARAAQGKSGPRKKAAS